MDHRGASRWRLIRPALLVAAAAVLAACGSATTGSTTSTTSGTTPGTGRTPPGATTCGVVASPSVVVTQEVGTCTAQVQSGVTIRLALDRGFAWNDPTSDSSAVQVTGVVRPPAGGLDATLRAVTTGRATITSSGGVRCAPGGACTALARLWTLVVVVH
jgi:hypothetical protein